MKIEKDIQIAQILIDIETKRERERCIDRGRDRDVDKRQQTGKIDRQMQVQVQKTTAWIQIHDKKKQIIDSTNDG